MTEADDDPTFDIPARPERRYSRTTVEYAGTVVFALSPPCAWPDDRLETLLRDVLNDGPYRYGDWFDLPMPLFLVHDDDTCDTFRVAVRDGRVELHVLPETDPAGLRALYDRLVAAARNGDGGVDDEDDDGEDDGASSDGGDRGTDGDGNDGDGNDGGWTVERRVEPAD